MSESFIISMQAVPAVFITGVLIYVSFNNFLFYWKRQKNREFLHWLLPARLPAYTHFLQRIFTWWTQSSRVQSISGGSLFFWLYSELPLCGLFKNIQESWIKELY